MDPTKTRDQPWCSQKVISFSYIHLYSQVREGRVGDRENKNSIT
jgi:hypothetical protein